MITGSPGVLFYWRARDPLSVKFARLVFHPFVALLHRSLYGTFTFLSEHILLIRQPHDLVCLTLILHAAALKTFPQKHWISKAHAIFSGQIQNR